MIRSMTAFARQQGHSEYGELTWEIRSVNHRYLEATVRLPEELRAIEPQVRERVTARLGRGKVECNLRFKPSGNVGADLRVNERLVDQVLDAADKIAHRLHSSNNPSIMDLLRWPGVLEGGEQDFTPLQQAAMELFDSALGTLVDSRAREGERLRELIVQRAQGMRAQVELARERMPVVIEAVRERLPGLPKWLKTSIRIASSRRWRCSPSASTSTRRWIACARTSTRSIVCCSRTNQSGGAWIS